MNKFKEFKSFLFHGVNLGLKLEIKKKVKANNKKDLILSLNQNDLLENDILFNEINTSSLFQERKIVFIENCNDKILPDLQNVIDKLDKNKIIIFSDSLDKKSKLRNFFEKEENIACIACYEDNEITLKKIINNKLKGFNGLDNHNINMILNCTGFDRVKLNNELDKILACFTDKLLDPNKLEALLNIKTNEDFNLLKDEAILGNKIKTNKLLSDTILEPEKNILYLNIINQRLNKIKEILEKTNTSNLENTINNLKPPIFWKDKPVILSQAKKWNTKKINYFLNKTYKTELEFKSNNNIDKSLLLKKILIDLCEIATT
ncbi:MAG: hypothetical protein VXW47_01390 [Pseudomonadota bacterium]|nr:hypothetical protein [Pseudomonadota bacterium]